MTNRLTEKSRRATEKNLTIAYSDIIRGHSYTDFEQQHLLLDAIGANAVLRRPCSSSRPR